MFHILKVCVKYWRLCPKCCADFDPVAFTKETIRRLDCRFKRNVYVSTEEVKFLVRRARVYERPGGIFPWEQERRVEMSLMDVGKVALLDKERRS